MDVETEYITKKPTNRVIQRYVCRTEILSSFRIQIGNISPSAIRWHFPVRKCRTKTPPKRPLAVGLRLPHLTQQCLGSPQAPAQTAAPTVVAPSHMYAVKSPLDTMARPKCVPKSTPSREPIPKRHHLRLIPGPARPMMPNGIRIRSAVFPQSTGQTDGRTHVRTDRPTERPRESLTTIGRCASRASGLINISNGKGHGIEPCRTPLYFLPCVLCAFYTDSLPSINQHPIVLTSLSPKPCFLSFSNNLDLV